MVALTPRYRRITFYGRKPVDWGLLISLTTETVGGAINSRWLVASVDAGPRRDGGAGWRVVVRLCRPLCPCLQCRSMRKTVSILPLVRGIEWEEMRFRDER